MGGLLMSEDAQEAADVREDVSPEQLPLADGPPHSWVGIFLGFAGLLILAGVAFMLTGQFIRSRPMDLKQASLEAADAVGDLLFTHQVPSGNIVASEPELHRTRSAHYYSFEYDVRLPDTVSLGGMAKLIERDLLPRGVLVSEKGAQAHLRALDLSMGDCPIATVKLSQAPPPQSTAQQSPIAAKPRPDRIVMASRQTPDAKRITEQPAIAPEAKPDRIETASRQTPVPAVTVDDTVAAKGAPLIPQESRELPLPAPEEPVHDVPGTAIGPALSSARMPADGEREEPGTWKVAGVRPRVAIIVDDGGYGGSASDVILGLTTRLTLSILPNTPFGTELAHEAALRGFEVMLHMPMENTSGDLTHDGQIETHMGEGDILRLMSNALAQVPGAVGVNNHMGSKFTAHAGALELFMSGVRDTGLFFVDSRTTPDSRAYRMAKTHGIDSAYRDLFLDHDDDLESIRKRFRELADTAKRDGSAIGICHFRLNTASVLREMLPELRLAGIELVHVSELVR